MNIAFRIDATNEMGTGHYVRCLVLAKAMKTKVGRIKFLSHSIPEHIKKTIVDYGFSFEILKNKEQIKTEDQLPHSHWLPCSQKCDANETLQCLEDDKWDWLVVDHYALDSTWEKKMKEKVSKIFVIDDLADRNHSCDVLLDQNLYINMSERYKKRVETDCNLLLGPSFALLRDEFKNLRSQARIRKDPIKEILISFGGADNENFTSYAINALSMSNAKSINVNVVIGALHPQKENIKKLCDKNNYKLHVQTNEMANLMLAADLGIGAGGSSSWERCCLGLPNITFSISDNQFDIAKTLSQKNGCIFISNKNIVDTTDLIKTINQLLDDTNRMEILSRSSLSLVDGKGCERVSEVLLG